MTELILELDTDEPERYRLCPQRVVSWKGRNDLLLCTCTPPMTVSARASPSGQEFTTNIVAVASRTTVGYDLVKRKETMHPVNVASVISVRDGATTLEPDKAVFSQVGFVSAA